MKRVTGILFSLFVCTQFIAGMTDNKPKAVAPVQYKTVAEIVSGETHNLTTSTEKVKAIHNWITRSIAYDVAQLNTKKEYIETKELVDEVLRKRKGVCQDYAELFQACCEAAKIESYVITGYTNQKGAFAGLGHAWNIVKLDGKFFCIDATWDAGSVDEKMKFIPEPHDKYLLVQPREFIKDHMPFDPMWQLLSSPLTTTEFEKGDFSRLNKTADFNFSDSIKVLQTLSLKDKLLRENKRMSRNGVSNPLIREKIAHNQLVITNEKYNAAVLLFNDAVASFNIYILQKNKQFQKTKLPDEQIQALLSNVRDKNQAANGIVAFLSSGDAALMQRINDLQKAINDMSITLSTEDKFVKKYIKTAKPFRMTLFMEKGKWSVK